MNPYLNNMRKKKEYTHIVNANIVVHSHLSDAIMELGFGNPSVIPQAKLRLQFAKFLINALKGDLNQEIDPDALYKQFMQKRGKVEIVEC